MEEIKKAKKEINFGGFRLRDIAIFVLIIIGVVHASSRNYLLFHAGIEIFSIIVAYNIWIIALNSNETSKNSFFTFLGVAYGFIGFYDLLHTLAYNGMGVFRGDTSNLATQLWIIARYIESVSLLGAFIFFSKPLSFKKLLYTYLTCSLLVLASLFYWDIFPNCFIPKIGLTQFKIISEYIIIAMLLASLVGLFKYRDKFSKKISYYLAISILFTILSEFSFTLYTNVQDILNMVGHLLKLVSFYTVYKSISETSLRMPYRLLEKYNKDLNRRTLELQRANEDLVRENNEKQRLTNELTKNGEILRSVLDSSVVGILVVGIKGEVIHISREFIEMFKIPQDIIETSEDSRLVEFISLQSKNPEAFKIKAMGSVEKTGKADDIFYFKDGRVYRRIASPLVVNGDTIGRVTIFVDMTEHKKAERLQREIELQETFLAKEREYRELQSQFFSNMSHELKTPLNVILGTIQLVALYFDNSIIDDNYRKMFKNINIMKQNCYRLIRLVNNIVDINKITRGFYKLSLRNNNIISVVEDITLSVADYIKTRGVDLIFDTDVEEKILACDPDKIERIMLNLLSNAIKFTDPGGRIEVNIYDREKEIQISVRDTGVGIPGDMLNSVFDRFSQVEGTIRRNKQGSGIGLSLVKSLVELHKGTIEVSSQVGVGTEFIIKLPVNPVKDEGVQYRECEENKSNHIERISIEFSDIYS